MGGGLDGRMVEGVADVAKVKAKAQKKKNLEWQR
jgi:hypothetical protein